MASWILRTALGLWIALWAVPRASAQSDADHLVLARKAAASLDYRAAIEHGEKALDQPDLSREQLIEIYELLGMSNGSIREADAAMEAFKRLLAIAPKHRLPDGLPPKIKRPFQEAGGFWIDRPEGLSLTLAGPESSPPDQDVALIATLDDMLGMAETLELVYRTREGQEKRLTQPAGASATFTVPSADIGGNPATYTITFTVRALTSARGELKTATHQAEVTAPVLDVPEPATSPEPMPATTVGFVDDGSEPAKPIYKEWWFWTAAGVAVAALGTGTYFLVRDDGGLDLSISMEVAE